MLQCAAQTAFGLGGIILENIAGAKYIPTLYSDIAAAGMTIIPKVIIIHVITTVDRPVTGAVHVCVGFLYDIIVIIITLLLLYLLAEV